MSKNNQTGEDEANHYARFDDLPRAFKKALRHASHDMTVGWVENLIAAHGEDAALKAVRHQLAIMRRATIIEHYGPGHPQLTFKSNHDRHA